MSSSPELPRELLRRRHESFYRWMIRVGLGLGDIDLFERLIEQDELTREEEGASDEDKYSDDEPIMPAPQPKRAPIIYECGDETFDDWLRRCPSEFAPIEEHKAYWNDLYRRGHYVAK